MIRAAATPEWLAGMTPDEAAAAWAVRLGEIPAAAGDEEAFRSWLESDPAHVDAWAAAMRAWGCLDNLGSAQDDALAALRSNAIDAGPERSPRCHILSGRFAAGNAGIIDQDINPAVANNDLVRDCSDLRGIADVEGEVASE